MLGVAACIAVVAATAIAVDRLDYFDASREGGFVESLEGGRAIVWAVGDGADGGEHGRAVAALIARGPVDRVLYLGDVYEEGTEEDFRRNYRTTYGRLASLTAPTSGNHETDDEEKGYDPYWQRAHGERPPDWYSFQVAGWTVLSLDSEIVQDDDDSAPAQLRWLQRQLEEPGTCRIAFWHRPRFSAGTNHGDDDDMAPLWEALRGHAVLVLNGHEHDMQRFKPIDGITQFVSGAGGAELYSIDPDDDRLAFGDDDSYGALRLDLRPGVARHAFVDVEGRILDSGIVRCRPLG